MKEFAVAARAAVIDEEGVEQEVEKPLEFKVGDDVCKSYRATSGQMAMMFSAMGEYQQGTTQAAAMIDFFLGTLDEDSKLLLGRKLLDRNDPFDLDQVSEIITWMLEEWSAPPYAVALKLCLVAEQRWAEIDGQCAFRGVYPFGLRIDRFLNLIYAWFMERVQDREEFDVWLEAPLLTEDGPAKPTQRELEKDGESFMAFMGEYAAQKVNA